MGINESQRISTRCKNDQHDLNKCIFWSFKTSSFLSGNVGRSKIIQIQHYITCRKEPADNLVLFGWLWWRSPPTTPKVVFEQMSELVVVSRSRFRPYAPCVSSTADAAGRARVSGRTGSLERRSEVGLPLVSRRRPCAVVTVSQRIFGTGSRCCYNKG